MCKRVGDPYGSNVQMGNTWLRCHRPSACGGDAEARRNLYAVGNRTHEKAVKFAEQYGIGKVYDKPEDMFADPDVDIIYISTPHNTHIKYLRQALAAGKHVLCEKSITLNYYELEEAVKLAMEHHVVLAEAQTIYTCRSTARCASASNAVTSVRCASSR